MFAHCTPHIAEMRELVRAATLVVIIWLLPAFLFAATTNWTNDSGGAFTTAANWNNGVPGLDDTAEFDRGTGVRYNVAFQSLGHGANITNQWLWIGSNAVSFESARFATAEYTATQGIIIGGEPDDTAATLNMNLPRMTAKTVTLGYYYHDSNGTLNIAGNRELIINGASPLFNESLIVGGDGEGTLNISGGADITLSGDVGDTIISQWGGGGTINISGAGSTFTTPANLIVADLGFGFLNATSGAQVNSGNAYLGYATAQGKVTIDGAGTAWNNAGELHVGYSRNGLLEVTGGAALTTDSSYVAYSDIALGSVLVDGAGSTWTTRSMDVGRGSLFGGNQNIGNVEIANGGRLVSTPGGTNRIGVEAGSRGTVKVVGPGSTWQSTGVIVGFRGEGSVQVLEGGQVTGNGSMALAYNPGSQGSVTIDGPGSMWTAYTADIGFRDGHGLLRIANGGQLNNHHSRIGTPIAFLQATGEATVDGPGSTWTNTTTLEVGEHRRGVLTVSNGGIVTAGGLLSVGPFGEIHGDGNIVAHVQNGGLVSPGKSPGALRVDGDYAQTATGELVIELASAASHDQLLVTDNATLDGVLTVNLIDGFTPSVGQAFTILTANAVDRTFSMEVFPAIPTIAFDVIYNAQSVVLTVVPALPGDYNLDGTVDAADYVVWRKGLGTTYMQSDYDVWRVHFGASNRGGSLATIPEPASFAILMIGISAMLTRRRPALSLNS
jgi:T5SS/PEP-CTERM-associated repeat protein